MADVDEPAAAKAIGFRLAGPIGELTSWASVFAMCRSQRRGWRLVGVDAIGVENRGGLGYSLRKQPAAERGNTRAESIQFD